MKFILQKGKPESFVLQSLPLLPEDLIHTSSTIYVRVHNEIVSYTDFGALFATKFVLVCTVREVALSVIANCFELVNQ